jgi:hypothetical protein
MFAHYFENVEFKQIESPEATKEKTMVEVC